jgi:hypothetical protein
VNDPWRLVRSWYERFLGRVPERAGLEGWVAELQQGTAPEAVLSEILGSPEYFTRCGSTPDGFVRTLFQELRGRAPNERELTMWIGRTQSESNRDVAYAMLTRYPDSWNTDRRWRGRDEDRRWRERDRDEDRRERERRPWRDWR